MTMNEEQDTQMEPGAERVRICVAISSVPWCDVRERNWCDVELEALHLEPGVP